MKKMIIEIDGTETLVDLTAEEIAAKEKENQFLEQLKTEAEAKAEAKAAAQAKLAALGLTIEDLTALGL
jgi:hypothetical protein